MGKNLLPPLAKLSPLPSLFRNAAKSGRDKAEKEEIAKLREVVSRLFHYLDEQSLQNLRRTFWLARNAVDMQPDKVYGDLFIKTPLGDDQPDTAFGRVAGFCHHLTVTLGHPPVSAHSSVSIDSYYSKPATSTTLLVPTKSQRKSRALWEKTSRESVSNRNTAWPTARMSVAFERLPAAQQTAQTLADKKWLSIFSQCSELRHLTLRVHGDPGWPGRTETEDTLITIRRALEAVSPPQLTEVTLLPIHAMGMMHLRWTGLSAYGSSPLFPQPSMTPIWANLQTLDLQFRNPFATGTLTDRQQVMFIKLLHDYLRSFTSTLLILRFTWLDADGPSPLALHLEDELAGAREPLRWVKLKEVWLGSITHPYRTIHHWRFLAPRLQKLMTRRTGFLHDSGVVVDHTTENAWIDQLLLQGSADDASSIYSRPVSEMTDASGTHTRTMSEILDPDVDPRSYLSGVSTTSRVVPFMLDMQGAIPSRR